MDVEPMTIVRGPQVSTEDYCKTLVIISSPCLRERGVYFLASRSSSVTWVSECTHLSQCSRSCRLCVGSRSPPDALIMPLALLHC